MPAPQHKPVYMAYEILAALMWGPKTVQEIADITGATPYTVRSIVSQGRSAGVYRVTKEKGGTYMVHLQKTPFDLPDEGLPIQSPNSYNKLTRRNNLTNLKQCP